MIDSILKRLQLSQMPPQKMGLCQAWQKSFITKLKTLGEIATATIKCETNASLAIAYTHSTGTLVTINLSSICSLNLSKEKGNNQELIQSNPTSRCLHESENFFFFQST